jgi:hypothetical protein
MTDEYLWAGGTSVLGLLAMLPYDFTLYLRAFPVDQYGPWMRLFTMLELISNVFIGLAAVGIKGKRQYQAVFRI